MIIIVIVITNNDIVEVIERSQGLQNNNRFYLSDEMLIGTFDRKS